MIQLHIEPGTVLSWEAFKETKGGYSIALDGYVNGPPLFESEGPYANFDHHSGINRLATRSTCFQVYLALVLGLYESFQRHGEPHAHVYVNDIDQDVCLAYWLLTHPEKLEAIRVWQPLARLIISEDLIDVTAGSYPGDPTWLISRQMAWIFEPYAVARRGGMLAHMPSEQQRAILDKVCDRVSDFVDGRAEAIDLDTRYEELAGGNGWKMIIEVGVYARTALYASGVRAFVACRPHEDGTFTYSIGKMSPFVPFPVTAILERLNELEQITDPNDSWGGTGLIGGSPRKRRSQLSPDDVCAVIRELVD